MFKRKAQIKLFRPKGSLRPQSAGRLHVYIKTVDRQIARAVAHCGPCRRAQAQLLRGQVKIEAAQFKQAGLPAYCATRCGKSACFEVGFQWPEYGPLRAQLGTKANSTAAHPGEIKPGGKQALAKGIGQHRLALQTLHFHRRVFACPVSQPGHSPAKRCLLGVRALRGRKLPYLSLRIFIW